jgi:hypothetical protein
MITENDKQIWMIKRFIISVYIIRWFLVHGIWSQTKNTYAHERSRQKIASVILIFSALISLTGQPYDHVHSCLTIYTAIAGELGWHEQLEI